MATTSFSHIPSAVMMAINAVGTGYATISKAYATIKTAFDSETITAKDGKLCLAMALAHHMPRDYKASLTKDGVVRGSALQRKVSRDWNEYVIGTVAHSTESASRVKASERAAWDAYRAAWDMFVESCGGDNKEGKARAAAVRKALTAK